MDAGNAAHIEPLLRKAVDWGYLLRIAHQHQVIPLLFCGKTVLEDIRVLKHLIDEGILEPPRFVPPQFADLHGLTAWMCFADFLGGFSFSRLETDYAELF